MPELPEVETTLRGIEPFILNKIIKQIIIRHPRLRWEIPKEIKSLAKNKRVQNLRRRGKYILLELNNGTIILHLGMSGRLRVLNHAIPPDKHDHVDIELNHGPIIRFTDPRRFGALLWTADDPLKHPLLKNLGPEPLSTEFTGMYLAQKAAHRKTAVKTFIMNSNIVVGVGNIYANEALFAAGINPTTAAGKISREGFNTLVKEIKKVLRAAIKKGGTTIQDFSHSEGKPGYFAMHLQVYSRAGLECFKCKTKLKEVRLGQRSTVYCQKCQPR